MKKEFLVIDLSEENAQIFNSTLKNLEENILNSDTIYIELTARLKKKLTEIFGV